MERNIEYLAHNERDLSGHDWGLGQDHMEFLPENGSRGQRDSYRVSSVDGAKNRNWQ